LRAEYFISGGVSAVLGSAEGGHKPTELPSAAVLLRKPAVERPVDVSEHLDEQCHLVVAERMQCVGEFAW
jgi:hypothetical protein